MRIAFAANPGLGHVLPLLPLALAARDAGHDVLVVGGASLGDAVRAVGLRHVAAGPADLRAVFERVPDLARATGPRHAVLVWSRGFADVVAGELADALLELARDWPPDLVVHDDSEQGTWVAAERLGIPHLAFQATAWRGSMRRLSVEPTGRLRARLGLPADPALDGWHRYGFLRTRPPALIAPDDPMPPGTVPIRPDSLDDAGAGRPAWLEAPRGDRPRVVVTLGTVVPQRAASIAAITGALASLDAEIIATVGSDVDPATVGVVPANVRVERYVPMSLLLPVSDVVVFHAGSGTMLAALAAGVPMLMLPVAADQPENARRCATAGVARVLEPDMRDPEAIRDGVAAILGDASMTAAVRRVQRQIEAMPTPAEVVHRLERRRWGSPPRG